MVAAQTDRRRANTIARRVAAADRNRRMLLFRVWESQPRLGHVTLLSRHALRAAGQQGAKAVFTRRQADPKNDDDDDDDDDISGRRHERVAGVLLQITTTTTTTAAAAAAAAAAALLEQNSATKGATRLVAKASTHGVTIFFLLFCFRSLAAAALTRK